MTLTIKKFERRGLFTVTIGLFFSALPFQVKADQITQAQKDSGWVSVFDGKTLNGFFAITGSDPQQDSNLNVSGKVFEFRASDSTIHTNGSPTSHIITKNKFSHYRVRIREKFDGGGNFEQNAGMLYHTRIEGPRMGAYPRSIEYQGQKRGMGEIWTISNVFVNVTIDPSFTKGHKYKAGGTLINHGGVDPNRQCEGGSVPYIDNSWNSMEALVRGSDSAEHWVNGVSVMKISKMRWSNTNDSNDMSNPLGNGSIALQAEGAGVSYRDFMIMELDPVTGKALYAKPTLGVILAAPKHQNLLHNQNFNGSGVVEFGFPNSASVNKGGTQMSIHNLNGRLITGFKNVIENKAALEIREKAK